MTEVDKDLFKTWKNLQHIRYISTVVKKNAYISVRKQIWYFGFNCAIKKSVDTNQQEASVSQLSCKKKNIISMHVELHQIVILTSQIKKECTNSI